MRLIKLIFKWMREPRVVKNGLEICVKRLADGSDDWPLNGEKKLTVVGVDGRVLQSDFEGHKYAIKIIKQDQNAEKMVKLARLLDPDGDLDWAVGASTEGNVKVLISKWLRPSPSVRISGVKNMLKALVKFWRQGLVHGDLRPPGWALSCGGFAGLRRC